jgi:hypothetical protein
MGWLAAIWAERGVKVLWAERIEIDPGALFCFFSFKFLEFKFEFHSNCELCT